MTDNNSAPERDALEHRIAEIIDHPSVYMGGPSRNSLRLAKAIVKECRADLCAADRGVTAPPTDNTALVQRAIDLFEGDLVGVEWKRACRAFITDARAALASREAPPAVTVSERLNALIAGRSVIDADELRDMLAHHGDEIPSAALGGSN